MFYPKTYRGDRASSTGDDSAPSGAVRSADDGASQNPRYRRPGDLHECGMPALGTIHLLPRSLEDEVEFLRSRGAGDSFRQGTFPRTRPK